MGDNIALSVLLFAIGGLNNKGNRIINRYYVVSIERLEEHSSHGLANVQEVINI